MQRSIPICRVCLKTCLVYIDLETPFDVDEALECSERSKDLTYLDCFRECTRLDVNSADHVSNSLCENCGMELRITYEFIKKAKYAALILQQAAEKTKIDNLGGFNSQNEALVEENDLLEKSEYEEVLDHDSSEQRLQEVFSNSEKEDILEHKLCGESEQNLTNDVQIDIFKEEERCDIVDEYQNVQMEEDNDVTEDSFSSQIADRDSDSEFIGDNNYANMKEDQIVLEENNTLVQSIYQCVSCEESFSKELTLQHHHQTKHRSNSLTYSCKICRNVFSNKNPHLQHIRTEHSHILKCSKCDFQEKEIKVYDHEQKQHQEQKNFLCNICSKAFATFGILNAHLKYHKRKQANIKSDACKICGKQFSTKHYLRLHMQVHANDRESHKCSQCEKMYVTKTALDNHMKLHKGETIKCVSCDKEFSRQYELNVHMRFHTRDYPFECEMCGKKFAIKGHLRTHMWRHQGLKLQCEDCGKLFTSSKALQEHSFTHSEMPYPCSYCTKAYPSKQKFKVHLKKAHSVELNENELQKIETNTARKPLQRKKLTLVQADSVMKEVEVKTKDEEYEEVQDFVVTLFK